MIKDNFERESSLYQGAVMFNCRKHGEFIGIESCPECDREEYIEKVVQERTLHYREVIGKMHTTIETLKDHIANMEKALLLKDIGGSR